MKKQIILLAVCLVVAAALGGTLWFLMGYVPEGDESSSSTVSSSVQLIEKTDYDLDTMAVSNEEGGFTLRNLGDGAYTIEGLEDAALTASMMKSAANCAGSLRADSVVTETPGSLGDFGLQSPRAEFTAKYTDGSAFSLQIGAEAPAGSGVYVRTPEKETVYLVSKSTVSNLLKNKLDFIDKTIVSPPETDDPQAGVQTLPEQVTLGGSFRQEEIVIRKTPEQTEAEKDYSLNVFEITAPKHRSVGADVGNEALSALLSLTAEEVAAYKPTDVELEGFGLTAPYSTVSFTYLDGEGSEQHVTLTASVRDEEGMVYVMRDGVPVVYRVQPESMQWYELKYSDLIATLQLLPYIDDVKTVTVEIGGKSTAFALAGESDELTVMADGKAVDVEQFRKFYQNLIGIPSEEYTTDEAPAEDTAVLRVTFEYRGGKAPDTLALLPATARKVFISINGEAEFYTKASYVDTVEKTMQQLLSGEAVGVLY